MTSSRNEISDAELRKHFLRAVSMLERPECDRAFVNRVLMACVARDPGNLIIVEKFLDNLSKMYAGQRRSKPGFRLRRAIKKAASANDWVTLFHFAPKALAHDPWNVPTLLALADACEAVDYREVGLRYLHWALDAQSDNVEVNRRCGRWLAQLGRFDEALVCWRQVERNADDDVEAAQMIAQLTTGNEQGPEANLGEKEELKKAIEAQPEEVSNYLKLADRLIANGDFAESQSLLTRAQTSVGVDLRIQERLEEVQIAHARHQVTIAEERAKAEPSDAAESLVEQLLANRHRVELEVFRGRVERYPNCVEHQFRLAETLKATGNFAEAVKFFHQTTNDDAFAAVSHLQMGECQQRLRRFDKAITCYEQAIQKVNDNEIETKMLALYRCGVLAEAMDRPDAAQASLTKLSQLAPDYRDIVSRLDKLRKIRHK